MINVYFFYRLAFLTIFMALITEWRYSFKKTSIIISSFMLIIWTINSIINNIYGMDFLNNVYPLTVSLPVFICFWKTSRLNLMRVLFSFLTVCNFGMLTSFFGLLTYFYTGSFFLRVLAELICFLIIDIFIIRFFRKPYFKILNTLTDGWGWFCIAPALLAITTYLSLYYPSEIKYWPDNIITTASIFALMFTIYLIVYISFEIITRYYSLKNDREFMLMKDEIQKKEYASILDKMNSIQIFRHDTRHHINAVSALLDDNNIAEARKYLFMMNNELSSTIVENYCENYMVNVILSSYISKAGANEIAVTCHADISEDIKLDNIDNIELASVFANAIENAINACKKIDNISRRKINIVCKAHNSQLYIQITNPFIDNIVFKGEFPVSSLKEHGFGTRSIAAVAEKNGGIYSFLADDGVFKTTVILNL